LALVTLPRRQLLRLASAAAALTFIPRLAKGQTYPSRPVRIVVGTAPASSYDILARLIGQWLSVRLKQPFLIQNLPGGDGNLATEFVVRAQPDGYTLLLTGSTDSISAILYDDLRFNYIRDIAPVAGIVRVPNLMVVHPSVPARRIPEFISYAKANPGKINMASAGNATPSRLSGELFKMMAGINMLHVPYRGGGPALVDLLAGQVQVFFSSIPSSVGYVRAGELNALGVTAASRSSALPDVPSIGDFLPGYDASALVGLGAPKDTPTAVIEELNKQVNAGLGDSDVNARLADLGGTALPGSAADFGKAIANETEKWAKVIKSAGIKPD
jgi:tripartite-type tricarboxylate transporter receptor subunit TctC